MREPATPTPTRPTGLRTDAVRGLALIAFVMLLFGFGALLSGPVGAALAAPDDADSGPAPAAATGPAGASGVEVAGADGARLPVDNAVLAGEVVQNLRGEAEPSAVAVASPDASWALLDPEPVSLVVALVCVAGFAVATVRDARTAGRSA